MIVNIAGWLYIVQGALGLWSLSWGTFGFRMSMEAFLTIVVSVLMAAMGYGLLQRDHRARWWALGSSLIAWVIGGLLIVVGAVGLLYMVIGERDALKGAVELMSMMLTGGGGLFVVVLCLLFVAIFIAVTVIEYKLFFHLCSREGCEEFGVEYGSSGTVLASAGAWVAVFLLQGMMSGGGSAQSALALMAAGASSQEKSDAADAQAREFARQDQLAAAQRVERLREAELEQAQRNLESDMAQQAEPEPAEPPADNYQTAPEESAVPAPLISATRDEPEETPSNKILKCRDKSGAVSYTQAYCPPGTTLVDTPKYE